MHAPLKIGTFSLREKLRWSLRYEGLAGTLLGLAARLLGRLGIRVNDLAWYQRLRTSRFDRKFRTRTAGDVAQSELGVAPELESQIVEYTPTASAYFGLTLAHLGIDYSQYTFVDYGSGKGRVLLMAAEFPFREIIGLELSPGLHRLASENIARPVSTTRQCGTISCVQGDATAWELPGHPTVLYFFNPFGEELMRRVISRIAQAQAVRPQHRVIIYYNPVHRLLFDGTPFLRPVPVADETYGREWAIYETAVSQ